MIIGRERELAELGRLVSGLPSGPAALLLQGEAGIGKTTIWEAGIAAAADASIPVLATRAVEGEMRLSFTAVGDLVAGELDEILSALPDPQRAALEVALLLARPRARAPDRRAVANAFLSALRILARRGPVAVAVDDVQWLDAPSASALANTRGLGMGVDLTQARRGRSHRVRVVVEDPAVHDRVARTFKFRRC